MQPDILVPITLFATIGFLIHSWIKAKYSSREERASSSDERSEADRALKDRLENAEDRLAVLERIVTDEGYVTARQIEALRDRDVTRATLK